MPPPSPEGRCALTAPFPPCRIPCGTGGLFSVALSFRPPRLAVSQPPALRSPDFPRRDHSIPPRSPVRLRREAPAVYQRRSGTGAAVMGLHQILPVDDPMARRAGLDAQAPLQHVVQLGRDVHVAALAGAAANADHGQSPAHADGAVSLQHLGLHPGRQPVALLAQPRDLPFPLCDAAARRLAVLLDRIAQRLNVVGPIRHPLLLPVYALAPLADLPPPPAQPPPP